MTRVSLPAAARSLGEAVAEHEAAVYEAANWLTKASLANARKDWGAAEEYKARFRLASERASSARERLNMIVAGLALVASVQAGEVCSNCYGTKKER